MRAHRYAVGQHVSYAEHGPRGRLRPGIPDPVWVDGYTITYVLPAGDREPQYQIHNADQSYHRVVGEWQLREDLGARG